MQNIMLKSKLRQKHPTFTFNPLFFFTHDRSGFGETSFLLGHLLCSAWPEVSNFLCLCCRCVSCACAPASHCSAGACGAPSAAGRFAPSAPAVCAYRSSISPLCRCTPSRPPPPARSPRPPRANAAATTSPNRAADSRGRTPSAAAAGKLREIAFLALCRPSPAQCRSAAWDGVGPVRARRRPPQRRVGEERKRRRQKSDRRPVLGVGPHRCPCLPARDPPQFRHGEKIENTQLFLFFVLFRKRTKF
jgi:hypothetical protein